MATTTNVQVLSPVNSPAAVVHSYIDAFNRGDEDGLAACFGDQGFILDGMAPHVWSGNSATRDWHKDAMAEASHMGISDFEMMLGRPTHDAIVGEAAYFTAPAILKFKIKGQQINQSGAMFTVALHRTRGEWRIAAWSWTKGAGGGTDDMK